MPLSDTEVIEKVHEIDKIQEGHRVKITNAEDNVRDIWTTITGMKSSISAVKNDLTRLMAIGGVVQTIAISVVIYWLTKKGG